MTKEQDAPSVGNPGPGEVHMTLTDDYGTISFETEAGESYSITFDPEMESIVEVIVSSVAAIRGVELTDLPPLHDTIDTEAIECVQKLSTSEAFDGGTFSFTYYDVSITVDLTGEVQLRRNG